MKKWENWHSRADGFIDLGPIKGNIGDQNYTLGPNMDRAVSV